jgi:hypothetical protein
VSIDSTTCFSCGLNLHAVYSGFHRVIGVCPLYDQVGMTVKLLVLCERTRMLR